MRQTKLWMCAAILFLCGMSVLTSCKEAHANDGDSVKVESVELIRTSQSWDGVELHGENRGTKPVILYMFYLSQKGLPLAVQHPEIPLD